jgi:hypothetical protein
MVWIGKYIVSFNRDYGIRESIRKIGGELKFINDEALSYFVI